MAALEVFYSYSHKDESLRQKLETHLSLLQRKGLIKPWTDRRITAGSEWSNQIDDHVRSADIILLLISPDFLASNYCFDIEMKIALERHEKKEAVVVPIILRPVDSHTSPFGKLQCVPRDGKPVTKFTNRDEAFAAIARELRALVTNKQAGDNSKHAEAYEKYRSWVVAQHRYIRFSGMAVVDERAEVEMAKVFVLPRVRPQKYSMQVVGDKRPEAVAVSEILTAAGAANRLMILGGPGSGKTTLLEALALAFVQPGNFPWAEKLPNLLPVFYRIRDLDKDLQEKGGVIWDRIQDHCCRGMQETLPAGFFQRQMHAGGLAILFDGLDEAGSLARRNEIVKMLGSFAAQLPAHCRLVVTSRPHDYRNRFDESAWQHLDLDEFSDEEIQTFIAGWEKIHQPGSGSARQSGKDLWQALKSRPDILPLARNALLLTMIVRVHFGLGALPDSRLGLYEKCTETLLKHWAEAKGLDQSPIDIEQKRKLLQRLAYEMQGEAEQLTDNMTLQIDRSDLARRFAAHLKEDGGPYQQVDKVIDRLHARDAILVQYGTSKRGQDQFGFVHRSFQEFFAAGWLANEIAEDEFRRQLFAARDGWNETLCLAVGQLRPDMRRRKTLLELLKLGHAGFAVQCLKAAASEQPWLRLLVQFLSKYTWEGREYRNLQLDDCAGACADRPETMAVLRSMFQRDNREGQSLAAAVELAEQFARNGNEEARALLDEFFAEAAAWPEDMVPVPGGPFPFGSANQMVQAASFSIDRHPVTNAQYERMAPGHRKLRKRYSDSDQQPAIYVNFFEAQLYARWRGCRLPTEQEWEKAASWNAQKQRKRVFPWGDTFDASLCNTYESRIRKTTMVGSYPKGTSHYGVHDMAGNVWEWTSSPWSESDSDPVIRGGSWNDNHDYAACVYRGDYYGPDVRCNIVGFRCARTQI